MYVVQSNMYEEVTFGTKKKWSYTTGDLLKFQLIWNVLWQEKRDLHLNINYCLIEVTT